MNLLSLLFYFILLIPSYNLLDDPINYIKTPNPLAFNGESYFLKWSSNPTKGYFKQEYLRSKDDYPDFNKMILVEYLEDVQPFDALMAKVNELNEMKKKAPATNYELIKSPDGKEFIIDFLVSNGEIYEWNVYKLISNKKGTIMYGFSFRSSENGEFTETAFFSNLKEKRTKFINLMIGTKIQTDI